MALIAPTIPTIGQPNSTEDADIVSALNTIVAAINGGLDSANLAAGAAITDAQLASPNNDQWRTVVTQPYYITDGLAGGTVYVPQANGVFLGLAPPAGVAGINPYVHDTSDFSVAGKTATFRLLGHQATNATAAGVTVSVGLYAATISGTSAITITTGASLGSAALSTAASSAVRTAGSLAAPTNGAFYVFGVTWTGSTAGNTRVTGNIQLQVRFT